MKTAQGISFEELGEYDFLELVVFAHKADYEGFAYACSDYPPRFERDAHTYTEDPQVLRVLLERFEPELKGFWKREGAQGTWNEHIGARRIAEPLLS